MRCVEGLLTTNYLLADQALAKRAAINESASCPTRCVVFFAMSSPMSTSTACAASTTALAGPVGHDLLARLSAQHHRHSGAREHERTGSSSRPFDRRQPQIHVAIETSGRLVFASDVFVRRCQRCLGEAAFLSPWRDALLGIRIDTKQASYTLHLLALVHLAAWNDLELTTSRESQTFGFEPWARIETVEGALRGTRVRTWKRRLTSTRSTTKLKVQMRAHAGELTVRAVAHCAKTHTGFDRLSFPHVDAVHVRVHRPRVVLGMVHDHTVSVAAKSASTIVIPQNTLNHSTLNVVDGSA